MIKTLEYLNTNKSLMLLFTIYLLETLLSIKKTPSINKFSEEFYLSRDTVEQAYGTLKQRNIITSIRGKVYYITSTQLISKINILFLVNKFSTYKTRIYESFINTLGPNSHVDIHVYHCDESVF